MGKKITIKNDDIKYEKHFYMLFTLKLSFK